MVYYTSLLKKFCKGDDYAEFIQEATYFIRKYICNCTTEIVVFKDNCPIHSTDEVEDMIHKMKIAVLPTVPYMDYSPCLNQVAEGYFGLTKMNNIMTAGDLGEFAKRCAIEANWIQATNVIFDEGTTISLLNEWNARMQMCKNGEPIFSNHIKSYQMTPKEVCKNLLVNVDRVFNEVQKQ